MSNPRLPLEITDHIIDLLHNKPKALKECCLVSKSWLPRARKHIFANIQFRSTYDIGLWKKAFPDPTDSPAYLARTLFVGCSQVVEEIDAEEGGWIRAFSLIERLTVSWTDEISLVPFRIFSSSLKSLRVTSLLFPHSQTFTLIRSLPLLEDLALIGYDVSVIKGDEPDVPPISIPLTLPKFTGTLALFVDNGVKNTAHRLLNLPNGLHFQGLNLSWRSEEDLLWVVKLVVACSDTLEYLHVTCESDNMPSPCPIDLSKATKLKGVVFHCGLSSKWVTATLETITSRHRNLQQISIHVPRTWTYTFQDDGVTINEINIEYPVAQWLDLDRLLLQFWDSRSIRPKVVYPPAGKIQVRDWAGELFPESTKRGIILVKHFKDSPR